MQCGGELVPGATNTTTRWRRSCRGRAEDYLLRVRLAVSGGPRSEMALRAIKPGGAISLLKAAAQEGNLDEGEAIGIVDRFVPFSTACRTARPCWTSFWPADRT